MIPRQLHIKNFLSYGPDVQIIDFAHHHLICLSGKNGHGKSALLDAITWAIWGQARKNATSSKPDSGLLHLGQKHMMVILEFEVNGQAYRIRREYLNTATKPFATVDFGVKNSEGKFIALTDKTIKDTQEKIETTIGITYESFVNSTFLRQGQSNEFSKKSPKERKEILAQILQLQKFEDQKKIAQQHARILHQDWVIKNSVRSRIIQELTESNTIHEQSATLYEHIQIIQQQLSNIQKQKKEFEQELAILQTHIQDHAVCQDRQKILKQELTHILEQIAHHKKTLETLQTYNIESLKKEEELCFTNIVNLQKLQQQKLQLRNEYLQVKEELTQIIHAWNAEFQQHEQSLLLQKAQIEQELVHSAQQQTIEQKNIDLIEQTLQLANNKVKELRIQITQLEPSVTLLTQQQKTLQECVQTYHQIDQKITQVTTELNNIKKKQIQLHAADESICSWCLQSVPEHHKTNLGNHLQLQEQELLTRLKILQTNHTNTQNMMQQTQHEVHILQQQGQTLLTAQITLQETSKQLITLQETKDQSLKINQSWLEKKNTNQHLLEQIKANMIHFEQTKMNQKPTKIEELTIKLHSIESQGKQINMQDAHLQTWQEKLILIQNQIIRYQQETSHTNKETHQAQLQQCEKQKEKTENDLELIDQKLKTFQCLSEKQQAIFTAQKNLNQTEKELQQRHQTYLIEQGTLQQKQKKIIALQTELHALDQTMKHLQAEVTDYQEIAKALGKDGIQALLIEQAIPEIEHETNLILSRLTNNQTQIFIESLRDLKKGGNKETLDIKIADSFGLRDYEMFSGGEAFRIDFALRIGISKLLARRAGTTLQTIFIDEGFGSQDEEGLQLIMDNLYKIQDNFAKIIIVSHLPEMKEHFPVQFIIEKKRSGSTVSIIQQG